MILTGGIAMSLLTLALHADPATEAPKATPDAPKLEPKKNADAPADAPKVDAPKDEKKEPVKEEKKTVTKSGLTIIEVTAGEGSAKAGDIVWVHYTGTLKDGTKFDSSRDRNEPIRFVLGKGQVIKGWDEGVTGMKVGEKRKLVIPPDLAYGAAGSPPTIPANSELQFDVELVGLARVPE
jgi:FKBP-type peptidyl-prolyl cis-trans isomerase